MSESLHIEYDLLEAKDLPQDEQDLLHAALQATADAYAPYSRFKVGCALGLENGTQITANNQENAAFPSGMCAERAAFYYAGAQGMHAKVRKVAVRGDSLDKVIAQPVTPCGACRQAMLEYERLAGTDFIVIMQGKTGKVLRVKGVARSLIPFGFDIDF